MTKQDHEEVLFPATQPDESISYGIDESIDHHTSKRCTKPRISKGCVARILIALLLLGFVVFLVADYSQVREVYISFIHWFELNIALGTFLLVLIYMLGTVLFVPGLLLTIGVGVALRAGLHSTWSNPIIIPRSNIAWIFGSVGGSDDWFAALNAPGKISIEENYRTEGSESENFQGDRHCSEEGRIQVHSAAATVSSHSLFLSQLPPRTHECLDS